MRLNTLNESFKEIFKEALNEEYYNYDETFIEPFIKQLEEEYPDFYDNGSYYLEYEDLGAEGEAEDYYEPRPFFDGRNIEKAIEPGVREYSWTVDHWTYELDEELVADALDKYLVEKFKLAALPEEERYTPEMQKQLLDKFDVGDAYAYLLDEFWEDAAKDAQENSSPEDYEDEEDDGYDSWYDDPDNW